MHHLIVVPVIAAIAVLITVIDPTPTLIVWGIESVVVVIVLLTSGRVDEEV